MKLPIAPRSEVELVRSEVDEWRRRAESVLGHEDVAARPERPVRRTSRTRRLGSVLAVTTVAAAVALGAFVLPGRSQSASPDVPSCISKQRYEHPIEGNQYQELVNALYACGVYRFP